MQKAKKYDNAELMMQQEWKQNKIITKTYHDTIIQNVLYFVFRCYM